MSDPDRYRLERWAATWPHADIDYPLFLVHHRIMWIVELHQSYDHSERQVGGKER